MPQPEIQILKFGGTSVAGLRQWQFIAKLCQQRVAAGQRILLVCSAISGCTDLLELMVVACKAQDKVAVAAHLAALEEQHLQLATKLGVDFSGELGTTIERLKGYLSESNISPSTHAEVLATGEFLSTRLGYRWLSQQSLAVAWHTATDLLRCESPAGNDWRRYLQADAVAADNCAQGLFSDTTPLIITQGFIAASKAGETCLLGRGGSDISAILMASALALESVEIYSNVPGVFSANPHLCDSARLLLELDYAEALEIAAAGAGVIHPRAIRCAQDHGIEIQMRQTGPTNSLGTRIFEPKQQSLSTQPVKAISVRGNMLALLLESRDQNRQVGFLAEVFKVFSEHGLAIEQVATSETTTTLSLHQADNRLDERLLERLSAALSQHCKLTLLPPATALTVIGRGIRTRLEAITAALGGFNRSRLLMVSVSANDIACTLLVPEADSHAYLLALHKKLIESPLPELSVFGPPWTALQTELSELDYDPRKAETFYFSSCEFDPVTAVARLGYRFDDQAEFFETIRFNLDDKPLKFANAEAKQAFMNALHILHLIAGVSYYKAGIPTRLVVDTLATDKLLEEFLVHLYQHGLAEFAHRNAVDLRPRLNFEFTGSMRLDVQVLPKSNHCDLLAMGGGKDSLVAAEMLKSMNRCFTTVAVGSSELIETTAKLTGAAFIRVGRTLAPQLQQLNAAGAWNGHVPVTAINAAILVCQGLLGGYENVIFANESSANSPNLQSKNGEDVNHQYSKGLDYEQRFQSLLAARVTTTTNCFSLLRPWRELAIVKMFSRYPQYFSTFSSCNRNFHLQGSRIGGRWCGDCPKCRFASLMLSLWLPRNQVTEIIGRDMLADSGQVEGFAQLCGFEGHKPFECVGEVEESCIAVLQLGRKQEYLDSPVVTALVEYVAPIASSLPTLEKMLQPKDSHLMPTEFSLRIMGFSNAIE
ncbi:MAG: aspartate kinase [Xanthomonadales bacterium]|nr:aspartate kinase [Xanthomonadales bacterium]